jgi:hypothetical protein
MPGCATRCASFRTDTRDNAWLDVRSHFGPITDVGSDVYTEDISDWNIWVASSGVNPLDNFKFGKWLIWKCSYGTINYGNLPTRKRDHVGISCIMCPYDSSSEPDRTRIWLGLEETDPIPTQSNHSVNYMRVAQRGNVWGFECTDPNCPYLTETGHAYFHA